MQEEVNIYLIPGMGANRRLYERMNITAGNIHYLDWIPTGKSRTLREYAELMAAEVKTTNNIIVGSSMGGMVAVEMAKLLQPKGLVLLSAPTGRHQFPKRLIWVNGLRIQKLLPVKLMLNFTRIADFFMGFKNEEHRTIFYEMLHGHGAHFIHFSVNAILQWDNMEEPPCPYIQVMGSKDKLFAKKMTQSPIVLEGGGHFTTFEKADEISEIINNYVRSLSQ